MGGVFKIIRSYILLALGPAFLAAAAVTPTFPSAQPFAKLPLAFEVQPGGARSYVAGGPGCSIRLRPGGAEICWHANSGASSVITVEFPGGRSVSPAPGPALPGKVNYYLTNNPGQWRTAVPTYDRITYRGVYPGIDIAWYGHERQLEFDAILQPGADPSVLRLRLAGAGPLTLEPAGELVARTAAGELRLPPPRIYQQAGATRRSVSGWYVLRPNGEIGFRLAVYDRSLPLVIDPEVLYSTPLGGAAGDTTITGVAVDPAGNIYVTGSTTASDFPTVGAPIAPYSRNTAFVSKIGAGGQTLLYSTFLGPGTLYGIAAGPDGAAWVVGATSSSKYPLMNPYQTVFGGGSSDAIVSELSPSGTLLFSTYLGGSGSDTAQGVAVDRGGNAYITGGTQSPNFPVTAGAYHPLGPAPAFVTKFNSQGSIIYSAEFEVGVDPAQGNAIAVDSTGSAYIAGVVTPPDAFLLPSSIAFLARLSSPGSGLLVLKQFGGSGAQAPSAIAVDANDDPYIAGYTRSPDFPVTSGAFQPKIGGGQDGFIAKWNHVTSSFEYATYLGGEALDTITGLSVDAAGNAYVTGSTQSKLFPLQDAFEAVASPLQTSALLQTADSGQSWAATPTPVPGLLAGSVSPDPRSPSTLVVSTEQGLFRTIDAGATWSRQSSVGNMALARSPADSNLIYGVVNSEYLYRSDDAGLTWNQLSNVGGLIIPDAADPSVAYFNYVLEGYFGCFKTVNRGVGWSGVNGPTPYVPNGPVPQEFFIDYSVPDGTLYGSENGQPYKSSDQGATWAPAAALPVAGPVTPPATGYLAYATSPLNPLILYAWVPGLAPPVVYISGDGGANWISRTLELTEIVEVVPSPTNAAVAYASGAAPQTVSTAFVAAIDTTGATLLFSTLLGPPFGIGSAIAVLSPGEVIVGGYAPGGMTGGSGAVQGYVTRISAMRRHGPWRR